MTLPPSASSSQAPSFAAGQVAGGRPTSADFSPFPLSPFPFLYLLPALFIPHWPRAAQLAGVAVRSQSQHSPRPPPPTSILPAIERTAAGHRHRRRENSSPFQFFMGVIWPSSSMRVGEGFVLLIFRGQVGRTEVHVGGCAQACRD